MLLPLALLAAAVASADEAARAPPQATQVAHAGPDAAAYLAELTSAARAADLAAERPWRTLLHHRSGLLGGGSAADGADFFLAPGGRRDPAAELEATLAGLLAPPAPGEETKHAQCRFPARLAWLSDRLAIDRARLPPVTCAGFDEFRARVAARSVTVVFSSYYLNNPASTFGHTFLRLNKGEASATGRRFELVDFGVDYGATVDTANPFMYVLKGLTGSFRGKWNHYPYFYKVRQYADYESRDLWEYDLALSPGETELLVAHLWELGSTWFDYFYLTENCSYGVLAALEAAAPRLELLRHLRPVVIPADTVKALFANPGLVRAVHFRPSIRTQFEARAASLTRRELGLVKTLVDDPGAPAGGLAPRGEARALDAALDYVDLAWAQELLDAVVTPAAELKQKLMERRSALLVQSDDLAIAVPDSQPQLGHGSLRVLGGGGASSRTGPLAVQELRLALHDLADPPAGYPAMAEIEFLKVRLRYEGRANAIGVEEGTFVDVVSLGDFSAFDRHLSWKGRIGATTVRDGGCTGCLAGTFSAGGGLGKAFLRGRLAALATTDLELLGAPRLAGTGGSPVRVGVGPAGLLRVRLGPRAALLGEASWRFLPWATPGSTFDLRAQARVHAGRFSLWTEASRWPLETQVLGGASLFL